MRSTFSIGRLPYRNPLRGDGAPNPSRDDPPPWPSRRRAAPRQLRIPAHSLRRSIPLGERIDFLMFPGWPRALPGFHCGRAAAAMARAPSATLTFDHRVVPTLLPPAQPGNVWQAGSTAGPSVIGEAVVATSSCRRGRAVVMLGQRRLPPPHVRTRCSPPRRAPWPRSSSSCSARARALHFGTIASIAPVATCPRSRYCKTASIAVGLLERLLLTIAPSADRGLETRYASSMVRRTAPDHRLDRADARDGVAELLGSSTTLTPMIGPRAAPLRTAPPPDQTLSSMSSASVRSCSSAVSICFRNCFHALPEARHRRRRP